MLAIHITGGSTAFRPGESLTGEVSWRLNEAAERVELRLFWRTKGKGTPESQVAEVVSFDKPLMEERRSFEMVVPAGPYSFSGKLISLVWGLELVVGSGRVSCLEEIVISATGQEVELGVVS